MDFWTQLIEERVPQDNFLRKINMLIDWEALGSKVKKVKSSFGRTGYDVDLMLKVTLLSQWYHLSDRELERVLKVRLDFMLFCGSSILSNSPDHSTICRFRNALVTHDLYDVLLQEVNRQLQEHHLMVSEADVAIVDATLITSAARPSKELKVMAEDRREDEFDQTQHVDEVLSADPDAVWLKKGNKSTFGYKLFTRTDGEGYIDKIMARPANENEIPHLPTMARGARAKRVLGDKGTVSADNRAFLHSQNLKSGLMYKAARCHPLNKWQKEFNRIVSKSRWVIEQSFGTMKRKFHAERARYMTRLKVEAEMTWKAITVNLLKAANRIEIS